MGSISVSGGSQTLNFYPQPLAPGVTVLATDDASGEPTMIGVEAGSELAVSFIISGGQVIPQVPFVAEVTVIGAAIGTMPVTARMRIGATETEPFGAFDDPDAGNLNDDQNPRQYILPDTYPAGTAMSVIGRSWDTSGSAPHMTVDSNDNTPLVLTLRDGDTVPDIDGFQDQASVAEFLDPYIDATTNTVTLNPNQAIYLFELYTTDLDDPTADFQDLVVLVSLASAGSSTASANRIFLPWGPNNFNPSSMTPDALQLLEQALEWARDDKLGGHLLHWDERI